MRRPLKASFRSKKPDDLVATNIIAEAANGVVIAQNRVAQLRRLFGASCLDVGGTSRVHAIVGRKGSSVSPEPVAWIGGMPERLTCALACRSATRSPEAEWKAIGGLHPPKTHSSTSNAAVERRWYFGPDMVAKSAAGCFAGTMLRRNGTGEIHFRAAFGFPLDGYRCLEERGASPFTPVATRGGTTSFVRSRQCHRARVHRARIRPAPSKIVRHSAVAEPPARLWAAGH